MYIVVENAGYIGEREVFTHEKRNTAEQWLARNYAADEIETLHVELAFKGDDGERTFEIC